MTWVTIPNSVFETGKPARAIDMRNLRDNIASAAAGEAGAPKTLGVALDEFLLGQAAYSSTPLELLGLGRAQKLRFEFATAGAAGFQMSFSNDGGATWGSYASLFTTPSTTVSFASGVIDLKTGVWRATGIAASSITSTGTAGELLGGTGTLTVPVGVDGVRIRRSTSTSGHVLAYAIEGRP